MKLNTKPNWRNKEKQTAAALGYLLDIQFAQNRPVTDEEIGKAAKYYRAPLSDLLERARFINENFTGR